MKNDHEYKRGYVAAMNAIKKDGGSVKAAEHHMEIAHGDLNPSKFTKGWVAACCMVLHGSDHVISGDIKTKEKKQTRPLRA